MSGSNEPKLVSYFVLAGHRGFSPARELHIACNEGVLPTRLHNHRCWGRGTSTPPGLSILDPRRPGRLRNVFQHIKSAHHVERVAKAGPRVHLKQFRWLAAHAGARLGGQRLCNSLSTAPGGVA